MCKAVDAVPSVTRLFSPIPVGMRGVYPRRFVWETEGPPTIAPRDDFPVFLFASSPHQVVKSKSDHAKNSTTMGKEDFKLGQTKELNPTAPDTEALTTFYTTLYQQRPDSEMAARFLMQHGLLPDEDLKAVFKKYGKGSSSSSKSGGSSSQVKKKPAANDDDDFQKKPAKKAPAPKKPPTKRTVEPDSSDEEFTAKAPPKKAAAKPPPKKPVVANDDDSSEDDQPLAKKAKK